jgi:hypothetical protein
MGGSKGKRVMSFSQMTTAAFSSGRKNVEELLVTARKIFLGGSGNKRKQSGPGGRCAHNWTSPVTFRSEQPTPVTHFRDHLRNIDGVIEEKDFS